MIYFYFPFLSGCDAIVIGLPVTTEGSIRRRQTDSQQGRRCRNFADAVAALAVKQKDLYVYLVDERGTTAEAEVLIGFAGGGRNDFKKKKDSVAAALILSSFFNDVRQAVRVRPPGMGRDPQLRKTANAPSERSKESNIDKDLKSSATTPTAAVDGS